MKIIKAAKRRLGKIVIYCSIGAVNSSKRSL
jgi:hypothetical protein